MNKVYLADFNYFNGYIQRNWNQNLEYTKGKRIRRKQKQGHNELLKLVNLVLDWNIKRLCTSNIYSKVITVFKEFVYCVR